MGKKWSISIFLVSSIKCNKQGLFLASEFQNFSSHCIFFSLLTFFGGRVSGITFTKILNRPKIYELFKQRNFWSRVRLIFKITLSQAMLLKTKQKLEQQVRNSIQIAVNDNHSKRKDVMNNKVQGEKESPSQMPTKERDTYMWHSNIKGQAKDEGGRIYWF